MVLSLYHFHLMRGNCFVLFLFFPLEYYEFRNQLFCLYMYIYIYSLIIKQYADLSDHLIRSVGEKEALCLTLALLSKSLSALNPQQQMQQHLYQQQLYQQHQQQQHLYGRTNGSTPMNNIASGGGGGSSSNMASNGYHSGGNSGNSSPDEHRFHPTSPPPPAAASSLMMNHPTLREVASRSTSSNGDSIASTVTNTDGSVPV
jgi:hypothetical protein